MMQFHFSFVSAALFIVIVDCIPLDSTDQELFPSDLIRPASFSDSTTDPEILADVNSYPLISTNSNSFGPSLSEGLIASASANVDDSNFNSLLQIPGDDETNLLNSNSNSIDPTVFGDSMTTGSDGFENPPDWMKPSFTLADNSQVPSPVTKAPPGEINVCCGHGDSLEYYCQACEFCRWFCLRIISSFYHLSDKNS